ncbi:hypothetical protein BSG1_16785 [Bacillus sp. SG-1]|nr:hypothetical protein BSG1_16785 [Bacillus sp. SG-1]
MLNAVFVYIVALGKIQRAGFFPWRQGLFSLNKVN